MMKNVKKFIIPIIFIFLFIGIMRSCSSKKEIPDNHILLSGFEDKKVWGTSPEKGFSIKRSKKHVTEGKYSLQVKYPKWNLPSINTKKLIQEWGQYDYFAFDVYNPHKETIDFKIRLDDTSGRRTNISRKLNPGENTVRIGRDRIAKKIDAGNVKFVVLFVNEPRKRYKLYFDNMHLKRSNLVEDIKREAPDFKSSAKDKKSLQKSSLAKEAIPVRKAAVLKTKEPLKQGSLRVAIAKIKKVKEGSALVSTGVPFALGQLTDETHIAFFNEQSEEISIATKVLARWPQDNSIRSVLVQFPYTIEALYEYVTFKWGEKRKTKDLDIVEPNWEYPEGYIVFPAEWLCDSQVAGEQTPMRRREYDQKAISNFEVVRKRPKTGNLRLDGYYSTPHVYYQLYVRSAEPKFFLEARKELLHYRENELQHEGRYKGASYVAANVGRYTYVQALVGDYLLTGDPRSLEVVGYMAQFLKNNFPAKKAYFPRGATNFWTERYVAFPLLGIISYYELTHDPEYLKVADKYIANLYKTQLEWPSRGGFIHNLYSHDPEEGARPDEFGGSPFMTGVLLEGIIKYHRLTQSDIAADSIFRAVDWLINEGLTQSKDTFMYLTADKYRNAGGHPDLNMLVVHAFGYAYRLSGYKEEKYLEIGERVFNRGLKDAFLKRRKQFNQNYRSSGHYLAYIQAGIEAKSLSQGLAEVKEGAQKAKMLSDIFLFEGFETKSDLFQATQQADINVDTQVTYLNGHSLRVKAKQKNAKLVGTGLKTDNWNIDQFSTVNFSYRLNKDVPFGMAVQTQFSDWICIGGTPNYTCSGALTNKGIEFINDGQWHETSFDVRTPVRAVLPSIKNIKVLQFFLNESEQKQIFWLDDFKIKR